MEWIKIRYKSGMILDAQMLACLKINEKKYMLTNYCFGYNHHKLVALWRIEKFGLKIVPRGSKEQREVEKFLDSSFYYNHNRNNNYQEFIEINNDVIFDTEENEDVLSRECFCFGAYEELNKAYRKSDSKVLLFDEKKIETNSSLNKSAKKSPSVTTLNKIDTIPSLNKEVKLKSTYDSERGNAIARAKIKEVLDYICVDCDGKWWAEVDTAPARHEQQKGLEVFRKTMEMLSTEDMQYNDYYEIYKNSFPGMRSRFHEFYRVSLTSQERDGQGKIKKMK